MKKYFRTKENSIYKRLFNDGAIIGANLGSACCDKNLNPIGETIIKESDTIEELCDVIVSIKKHEGTVVEFDILWSWLEWREELAEEIVEGAEIYGAIFTDKGLIYVTKMNEKGEFELL